VIKTVCGHNITEKDLKILTSINKLQPGMDTSKEVALLQLEKTYLSLTLADSLGVPITDSVLQREAHRIAVHTHMPHRIDSIRRACGDSINYIRYFVLPQLVNRWLYYYFLWDSTMHINCKVAAQQCINEINYISNSMPIWQFMSGMGLEQIAKKKSYNFFRYKANYLEGILEWNINSNIQKNQIDNSSSAKNIPSEAFLPFNNSIESSSLTQSKQLINEVLKKLKTGQVYPYPVEFHNSFWIIQLIDNIDSTYFFATIQVPKNDFFKWFESKRKQLCKQVDY